MMPCPLGKAVIPESLADIRKVYDRVMAGEKTLPRHQSRVHQGFYPEEIINAGLREFLGVGRSNNLVSAIIGHLVFEIVHPFS